MIVWAAKRQKGDFPLITADYHTHTAYSEDSETSPEAMVKRAVALGLKTLCITDHMDYLFPEKYAPETFVFDPRAYFKQLLSLREAYRGRLEIRIGVELGLRSEPDVRTACIGHCKKLAASYPFDFIIGSTHVLEHTDPYYPEYWESHSAAEGMQTYFESILESTENYNMFQVCGHLDYLVRYLPQETKNGEKVPRDYCFADYKELIGKILKKLIESGRGIEVNTAAYKYGLPFAHPRTEILKLYKQLGGEILTIGSDAHATEHMAHGFARAEEMLCSLGFRYYTVYRERTPAFLPLG